MFEIRKESSAKRTWLADEELTWWQKLTMSKELRKRARDGVGFDQAPGDPHGSLSRVGQWSKRYREIDRMPYHEQAKHRFAENARVDKMFCPCNRRPVIDNPYRCLLHINDAEVEPDPGIIRRTYDGFR